ncbi:RCC1 domain-containing protein 1 isoform X1 [Marmota marmota marmota]|uniref:RCC1 domain-containing protein 1 isoform X1 n=2 Tax=Marmota marmota marmota TaxID=9994 RepID=UPI0020937843|nr:RCC1 domain-containing protein 1 isoform X1 [Marmota marmota marmota]XP_048646196.1 RCC1 domain-containing protein 1 isoform X1 [Marmota marmota marmota]XP_048646197.1 RCC1 domain-containing protein 1 isoform X1 [Marmota marmota marmota]XP_048646198.1 RCC1 domain-containing protein 1 isoform X1 [Marmota marmota marmota]XP_048646199.1 RCC1 domain-containing protein 1 isoform X1 [Marmota marmota marmota]XP_048646200.1 RCC1 domain-containing protein 1 isoform X1 [Marmota marmota marmota]XP_04
MSVPSVVLIRAPPPYKEAPAPGRPETQGVAPLLVCKKHLCSSPIPGTLRPQPGGGGQRALRSMAGERPGAWFGFGFCGFGQALGSRRGRQVRSPEPLRAGVDVCRVSASWSYTAFVTRAGRLELSGSTNGAADDCRDAWASEGLLVVIRTGTESGTELQAWTPGSELRGAPLWTQKLAPEAEVEDQARDESGAGSLPLLPGACAYVSPQPPFSRTLVPELRARRLELGAEHVLLLCAAGQVFSWGGGRHGQLGHGTLEAELEPRLLEALQGLPMAEVAAGGWHSVCVSETGDIYIWGWNESGQLALPARNLAEDKKIFTEEGLNEDGSEVNRLSGAEDGAPAPFISVQPFPALLDLPLGSDVVKASCGSRHTAVVTRTGELYTWGWGSKEARRNLLPVMTGCHWTFGTLSLALEAFWLQSPGFTEQAPAGGKYGQLGHKDSTSVDQPCLVEYFVEKQLQVKTVTCGPWNTYVFAVEKEKT